MACRTRTHTGNSCCLLYSLLRSSMATMLLTMTCVTHAAWLVWLCQEVPMVSHRRRAHAWHSQAWLMPAHASHCGLGVGSGVRGLSCCCEPACCWLCSCMFCDCCLLGPKALAYHARGAEENKLP
jgi:hypothetical protein